MKNHNAPYGALIQPSLQAKTLQNFKPCRNHESGSGTACLSVLPSVLPVAALLVSAFLARPAEAVTLRQKWVPGQQLTYETTVGGKMTLLADDASPQPWAGLPIDFRVRGNGAVGLDALSVAPDGIGTVALSSGDGRVRALGFGQVMEMTIKDGVATALLNGKPMLSSTAPPVVVPPAATPPKTTMGAAPATAPSRVALRLAPDGHIVEVVTLPVDKKEPASGVTAINTASSMARTAVNTAATMAGVPFFDFSSLAQSWFVRALPAFWPTGDVEEGAQWTVPLTIPLPAPKTSATAVVPAPVNVGKATLTLRGTEEISGRKTRRVGLQGSMEIDGAKAKILNEAAKSVSEKNEAAVNAGATGAAKGASNSAANSKTRKVTNTTSLADARQTMNGDLWLDTATGQVVQANVTFVGKMHSKGEITNKAGKTRPTETWADFDVSLQMLLRKISYASKTF